MKMKNKNLTLLVLATVCMFGSCSSDDDNSINPGGKTKINFLGTIGEAPNTRASGNTWDVNDAIGLYMKSKGEDLTAHVIDDKKNIKYITPSGNGEFLAEKSEQAIIFPEDGQAVDFIAYHPFITDISNYIYKVDLLDQTNPASIDLLYSDNAKNLNKDNPANVGLVFIHQLTKIRINIAAGEGIDGLTGLTAMATGMMTKADFLLATGTLVPTTDSAADFKFVIKENGTQMIAEAIVMPSPGTNNRKITFSIGSKLFSWSVPDGTEFVQGKVYTYNATISSEELVVTNPNGTITDWDEVSSGNIEAEFDSEAPVITINQTAETLNGLDENATITLSGEIKGIVKLTSAKLIITKKDGSENIFDLLAASAGEDISELLFEKDIAATADLSQIRIEAVDINDQRTTKEFGVHVGYYFYNLRATGSGNDSFPDFVAPFVSAAKGKSLGFCEAQDISEFVEVAFSTFTSNTRISVTNIKNSNEGKFRHPTCNPRTEWGTMTAIPLTTAANIKRSNFSKVTINNIKQENPLTTGGTVTIYLTNGSFNNILDDAILYQTSVDGVDKRVLLCIDRVEDEAPTSAIQFWVNVMIEK